MRIVISLFLLFLMDISYAQNKTGHQRDLESHELIDANVSPSSKDYTLQKKTVAEHQTGKKRKTVFVRSTLTPFKEKNISKGTTSIYPASKKEKEIENGRNTVFVEASLIPFEDKNIQEKIPLRKTYHEKEVESEEDRKTVIIEATLTPVD